MISDGRALSGNTTAEPLNCCMFTSHMSVAVYADANRQQVLTRLVIQKVLILLNETPQLASAPVVALNLEVPLGR